MYGKYKLLLQISLLDLKTKPVISRYSKVKKKEKITQPNFNFLDSNWLLS